jgi:hypothetical protein
LPVSLNKRRESKISTGREKLQYDNSSNDNSTISNPYTLFLYALNSPVTRERYSTRLRYFLAKIGLMGNNNLIEELCRIFVEKGKQDPNWIINNTVAFLIEYKDRYDRREISGSTIRNYVNVFRLLCEMSDTAIPWKKITLGLPKGRQWVDDRAPNIDEYEGYVNIQIETSQIAAFLGSFLLLSAENQQMNGYIIIWRLLSCNI